MFWFHTPTENYQMKHSGRYHTTDLNNTNILQSASLLIR